jgi:hypothetical protein
MIYATNFGNHCLRSGAMRLFFERLALGFALGRQNFEMSTGSCAMDAKRVAAAQYPVNVPLNLTDACAI